jgi:hypothetical protein
MPVICIYRGFAREFKGSSGIFLNFSCFPKWHPPHNLIGRAPLNRSGWGSVPAFDPTSSVIAADGPAYIAFRHHAVVSMLRNFVLSPRER